MRETRANLEKIRRRYYVANRQEKTKILDELCHIYDYNRKYLIHFFRGNDKLDYAKRGPKPRYQGEALFSALRDIWLATDLMCSKRLKSAIPLWLPFYNKPLSQSVKSRLLSISPATIDRLLKPYKRHGLSGTKPGYLLKNQIPIKTNHWDTTIPGFVEADTVAHCGNSLQGDFIWSITLTDIVTCWTENRGVWNKGAEGVVEQIKAIEKILPFQLLGFDCDNGLR